MSAVPKSNPCTLLDWDSRFWGFTVARLDSPSLSTELLHEVAGWCAAHHVRCLYFRADGSCPHTLALAHAGGFRFVDVRVELSLTTQGPSLVDDLPHGIVVRHATNEDLARLKELAALAHRDTRFFKDDRFDATKAAELYRVWIDRDFATHAVMVCAPLASPGRPCGYVTCEYDAASEEGRIGLIAVDPEVSGKGVGTRLLRAALRSFPAHGIRTIKVVTQATNVPAMRLYEAAGFRTSDVSVWFHKWFPEEMRP